LLRYSLASLAAVIVCLSIYSAALAHGDEVWQQISVTLTLSILLFATLAAVFSRSRTFAIGFSIVGWLYFAIAFLGFSGGVRDSLLTHTAINWLYGQVHAPGAQVMVQAQPVQSVRMYKEESRDYHVDWILPTPVSLTAYHFAQIGHSLWAVLIGAMGGVVAQVMNARSRRSLRDASPAT
jgi:hypothetical protein